MNNESHDHSEMNSRYCPVCGDKLKQNLEKEILDKNIVETVEHYYNNTTFDVKQIHLNRETLVKAGTQQNRDEKKVSKYTELFNAPVTHTSHNIKDADIIIQRKAGATNTENFESLDTYTLEELKQKNVDITHQQTL